MEQAIFCPLLRGSCRSDCRFYDPPTDDGKLPEQCELDIFLMNSQYILSEIEDHVYDLTDEGKEMKKKCRR